MAWAHALFQIGAVILCLWCSLVSAHQAVGALKVNGACELQNQLDNLVFDYVADTLSGAPYYKAHGKEFFLYWDPDCSDGKDGTARWIIDHHRPLVNKTEDLDDDGECTYIARADSKNSHAPPIGNSAAFWKMQCDSDGAMKHVVLELVAVVTTTTETTTTLTTTTHTTTATRTRTTRTETTSTKFPVTAHSRWKLLGKPCVAPAARNGTTTEKEWVFKQEGFTKAGAPIYKLAPCNGNPKYIYHDEDCDNSGLRDPRWIIDDDPPSLTAKSDMDSDGKCKYHARHKTSLENHPSLPMNAVWHVYCYGKWEDHEMIFEHFTEEGAQTDVDHEHDDPHSQEHHSDDQPTPSHNQETHHATRSIPHAGNFMLPELPCCPENAHEDRSRFFDPTGFDKCYCLKDMSWYKSGVSYSVDAQGYCAGANEWYDLPVGGFLCDCGATTKPSQGRDADMACCKDDATKCSQEIAEDNEIVGTGAPRDDRSHHGDAGNAHGASKVTENNVAANVRNTIMGGVLSLAMFMLHRAI